MRIILNPGVNFEDSIDAFLPINHPKKDKNIKK